jgi:hypothetical protein
MRDSFSEPFDVLLSGGIDSEVMVRTFKDLGITHNTFIFRYEDDLNIRDINSSIQICEALNIPYKIIDFNLSKFYEQDAKDIFEKTLVPDVASLSRIKWLDYLDNIPVFGEGEPYWKFKGGPSFFVQDLVKFLTESGEIYSNNHSKQYLLSAKLMKEDYIIEIPSYIDTQEEQDEYIDLFAPKFWKDKVPQ